MSGPPIAIQSAAESRDRAAEWKRVRHLSRWAANRRLRRTVLILWIAVLVLDVKLSVAAEQREPHAVIILALVLFLLTAWAMRRMGNGLAQPTLEDRAVLEYGEDFDRLREKQRAEVFDQQVRDNLLGRSMKDIRDSELRTQSEAAAYCMLVPILLLGAVLCWTLSLLPHFAAHRHLLVVAAIALTCSRVLHFALPIMIRLWTEPDQIAGDTHLVADHPQP